MAASYMHCNNHIFWHADLTCSYIPSKQSRAAARQFGVRNGLPEKEVKRMDSGNLGTDDEPVRDGSRKFRAVSDKSYLYNTPLFEIPETLPILSPKIQLPATPVQILRFLLSDAALQFCIPHSEYQDIEDRSSSSSTITYYDLLTPFEELLCAVVFSRSIPHHISLQIIRTILNAPYGFRNPVAIKTAGHKKVLEALNVARTPQTAEEIDFLAETISSNNWHNDLSKLRIYARNGIESEREILRRNIKGLGRIGMETFYRRVQWQWHMAYASVDNRSQNVLEKLGLPRRAEGIVKMIEVRWGELKFEDASRDYGLEEKRRRAFVILLERAIGVDMEGRIEEIVEGAVRL
jgi:hypothetical protein